MLAHASHALLLTSLYFYFHVRTATLFFMIANQSERPSLLTLVQEDGGTTPLLAAIKCGHHACVNELLEAGANIRAVDKVRQSCSWL